MTEYYLDDDWNLVAAPASKDDISRWANAYQQRFFPEPENVEIAVLENLKGVACFVPEKRLIAISRDITLFHSLTRIALLHEMIHVKLHDENGNPDEAHGARFKAEIERLIKAGAYSDLL
jgi:hypothetical protein